MIKHLPAYLTLLILLISCSDGKHKCLYQELKLIQTIRLCNGNDCSYQHQVLCNGLEYECLDSTAVMSLVKEYISKNSLDTPIHSILIFNSEDEFDEGETLSQPDDYYEDLVLGIELPNRHHNHTVYNFIKSGYKGTEWKKMKD